MTLRSTYIEMRPFVPGPCIVFFSKKVMADMLLVHAARFHSRLGDACIRLELQHQHSPNPRRTTDAVGFIVVEPMILGLYTCCRVSPSAVATVESALVLLVVNFAHAQFRGCGSERQVEDFWLASRTPPLILPQLDRSLDHSHYFRSNNRLADHNPC